MKNLALALAPLALLCAAQAGATVIHFKTFMTGPNENPSNASPGTGNATVVYDSEAHTLDVDAIFSGLLGMTTVAHIHCCVDAPGNTIPATPTPTFPGFPAGVSAGVYSVILDLTLLSSFNPAFVAANGGTPAAAEAALITGLNAGRAYFNIHTNLFPGGEIRGFLQVPEPGTIGLVALAMGALALRRKRKA